MKSKDVIFYNFALPRQTAAARLICPGEKNDYKILLLRLRRKLRPGSKLNTPPLRTAYGLGQAERRFPRLSQDCLINSYALNVKHNFPFFIDKNVFCFAGRPFSGRYAVCGRPTAETAYFHKKNLRFSTQVFNCRQTLQIRKIYMHAAPMVELIEIFFR